MSSSLIVPGFQYLGVDEIHVRVIEDVNYKGIHVAPQGGKWPKATSE